MVRAEMSTVFPYRKLSRFLKFPRYRTRSAAHSTRNAEWHGSCYATCRPTKLRGERNTPVLWKGGAVMRENREEWMQLCEQAASEQDPEQLMTLVEQISVLLEAREQRLKGKDPSIRPPAEAAKGSWPAPAH